MKFVRNWNEKKDAIFFFPHSLLLFSRKEKHYFPPSNTNVSQFLESMVRAVERENAQRSTTTDVKRVYCPRKDRVTYYTRNFSNRFSTFSSSLFFSSFLSHFERGSIAAWKSLFTSFVTPWFFFSFFAVTWPDEFLSEHVARTMLEVLKREKRLALIYGWKLIATFLFLLCTCNEKRNYLHYPSKRVRNNSAQIKTLTSYAENL